MTCTSCPGGSPLGEASQLPSRVRGGHHAERRGGQPVAVDVEQRRPTLVGGPLVGRPQQVDELVDGVDRGPGAGVVHPSSVGAVSADPGAAWRAIGSSSVRGVTWAIAAATRLAAPGMATRRPLSMASTATLATSAASTHMTLGSAFSASSLLKPARSPKPVSHRARDTAWWR